MDKTPRILIEEIMDKTKWSKYRIAKELGIPWNTLQMWYKGVFTPRKKNMENLLTMHYKHCIIVIDG